MAACDDAAIAHGFQVEADGRCVATVAMRIPINSVGAP